jgi:uncharacterized protein
MSEATTFRSTDGLSLEAEVDTPQDPKGVLVLCHPHPKMGGTMRAPLLEALRDELVNRGWAVVRFNFRGIGESEGDASTGEAEVADAQGAVAFARERFPDKLVAIAGWSFGGAVAVRTAQQEPDLIAVVAIAPSVKERPGITVGLPAPGQLDLAMPLTVVCGANDDLIALDDCKAWSEEASGASCVEVPGANHFFWAKYEDLAGIVGDALDGALQVGGGQ